MFKFRFPHKPNAKTKLARRVFFVRKRTLAIPAGLAAVCALCLITTLPSYVSAASTQRQLPIYCVQREDKVCSLTFDAAWGNEDTQQLIDILGRYHVKATFFVVGDWVEKYPESVKALSDAGHEVMSHSDTHAHFNALSAQEIVADLTTAGEKIAAVTGKTPTLFRPPFGEYDDHVIATVRGMGIEPIQWDVEALAASGSARGASDTRAFCRLPGPESRFKIQLLQICRRIHIFLSRVLVVPHLLPENISRFKRDGYFFNKFIVI